MAVQAATAVTKIGESFERGYKEESYSFTIDLASVGLTTQDTGTIAVTGARAGDPCTVVLEAPPASLLIQGAKVTANDVVTFYAIGTATVDAGALAGYLTIKKRSVG